MKEEKYNDYIIKITKDTGDVVYICAQCKDKEYKQPQGVNVHLLYCEKSIGKEKVLINKRKRSQACYKMHKQESKDKKELRYKHSSESLKLFFNNNENREKRSLQTKKQHENMSSETKTKLYKKISKSVSNTFKQFSLKEKEEFSEKVSKGLLNMSQEEKEQMKLNRANSRQIYLNNRTEEDILKQSLSMKKYWGELSSGKKNEIISKREQTCLEKYKVRNYFLYEDAIINRRAHYKYNNINFDSLPELCFYLEYEDKGIERNSTKLKFTYLNKEHITIPDFKINNILYEIKGDHFKKNDDI